MESATTEDIGEVIYPPLPGGGYRILEGNIGYVNAGSLTEEDIKKIPAALQDTVGMERYKGKVAVLVNDNSISQAEFTAMALRSAPGAVVIGNPTAGADGDIVELPMPGGISFWYSGLGIYTPEGKLTQHVGIQPDVLCVPTPEGLRAGRDEQLEKAVALIGQER